MLILTLCGPECLVIGKCLRRQGLDGFVRLHLTGKTWRNSGGAHNRLRFAGNSVRRVVQPLRGTPFVYGPIPTRTAGAIRAGLIYRSTD